MPTTQRVDKSILRQQTAPQLLCQCARSTPEAVAFRTKSGGRWLDRTWHDYARMVAGAAAVLEAHHVAAGDRVAILADVCEEWVTCDMAAQSLGAIVYGIYPTASIPEIEYQLAHGGAVAVVASAAHHLVALAEMAPRLPNLRTIFAMHHMPPGLIHQRVKPFSPEIAGVGSPGLSWLEDRTARVRPDAPAFIVYTSGTTGHPKGALVLHGKHLAAVATVLDHYPTFTEKAHRTAVFLSPAHVLGRDVAITLPLLADFVPHFGDLREGLPALFAQTKPSILFIVPRLLQKFGSSMVAHCQQQTGPRRLVYQIAMKYAGMHVQRRWARTAGTISESIYRLIHKAVLRPIIGRIGFDQLELVLCGGAALGTETMALWHMYGVNVVDVYGQTEEGGAFVAGQTGPFSRPGDVGFPPPGCDVRLAEDGEVLVRNPDVFEGYWQDDDATRAVKGDDGWLRTGDIGTMSNGALRLIDRARDFIVTAGGKTISPSFVESVLRASPYMTEAVVIGHGRKYLVGLIEIDFEAVAQWARKNGLPSSGFEDLAQSEAVRRLIAGEIEKANAELGRVEQIKDFRLLPRALDPTQPDEPVTATRKVKRQKMHERFRELIDSMYDAEEERLISEQARSALTQAA